MSACRASLCAAAATLLVALASAGLPPVAIAQASPEAGSVRFVKRTDTAFDRYTSRASPGFRAWMRSKFSRSIVFSPYFDDKTHWYPNGWVYRDLYAIYRDSATARERRSILRAPDGTPLYIPYDCDGSSCTQYAADVGDPSFRRSWIRALKRDVAEGYAGVWIDDVNLEFRVSDGAGEETAPLDRRTGQPMTAASWRRYVAEFVEQIRRALPKAEIVHNSIWFAARQPGGLDPSVRRQIAAADYVNLERGVNDDGLTGGTGEWSLRAFLSHIDRIHAMGRHVVLDGFDASASGREYSLAAYFLFSDGRDAVGLSAMHPGNWWPAYDVDLGSALDNRRDWQGLLRRDFSGGMVLVNEPEAPVRVVDLPTPMVDTAGRIVTSVSLGPAEGAVLRRTTPVTRLTEAVPGSDGALASWFWARSVGV